MKSRSFVIGAIPIALMTIAASVAAAQGTLTGTVTAQVGGTPLQEARVIVMGTSLFATTGPDGKYTVRRVPAGTAELRVIRVGYQEQKKSVRIIDGQTATLDFAMPTTVVQLQEVVTTATGEQRRVEIGNAVENLSVSKLMETSPIRNMADVLNSRVPGVMVQSGGQTGSGQRVRVRGVSSVSLANDPIYIIDGIRMSANNGSSAFGNGGSNFSRVGDIDPQQIENIEIVKGPSAATLYGTDAANGVIVITTKKGRAGSARWNVFAEGGVLSDRNWYSDNYTLAGVSPTGKALILNGECNLPMVSAGTCKKTGGTFGWDSLRVYNPITDPTATPLGLGYRNAQGVQVSAGTDAVRYFISAGRDAETGVFKLPEFEQNRYDSLGIAAHEWTTRPNQRLLNSFRGNINAQINEKLDAAVNFGYTTVDQRTSNESNNTVGIGSQAFGGPGYKNNGFVSSVNTPLNGYRAWTPAYAWEERLQQNVNRVIMSSNINWRPTSWLQTRANVGTDLSDRVDIDLNMNGEGAPISTTQRDGFAANARANINNLSADLGATANYNPSKYNWMSFKTTVGTQYNNFRQDQNSATGTTLPPGAVTASAGATPNATESTIITKTWGVFVEEQLALRDRLFLTGAVRTDQNSAFGTDFQRVYYPKGSVSWQMSDESFFPKGGLFRAVSSLRYRLAYGASGVQPGPNTANRTYSANSGSIRGSDQSFETFNTIGNDSLKPERSTEWETGIDTRLFGSRIQFDVTYYSRLTHDALIAAIVPPSAGIGATTQQQNLGAVKNAGWELTVGGPIVDRRNVGLDFLLTTSLNANKVVSLQHPASGWYDELGRRRLPDPRSVRSSDHRMGGQEQGWHPDLQRERRVERSVRRRRHDLPWLRRAAIPDVAHVGHRSLQAPPSHPELVRLARRQPLVQQHRADSLRQPQQLQRFDEPERVVPGAGDGRCDVERSVEDPRWLPAARCVREVARSVGHVDVARSVGSAPPRSQRQLCLLGAQPQDVDELPRNEPGERLCGRRGRRFTVRVPDIRTAHVLHVPSQPRFLTFDLSYKCDIY